jgi:hypothetical protein
MLVGFQRMNVERSGLVIMGMRWLLTALSYR